QRGESVAGGEAPGVDRPIRAAARLFAEAQGDIGHFFEPCDERGHRLLRIEMRFPRKIERLVEAPFKVGLERRDARAVKLFETLGAAREVDEFGALARRRDDETALDRGDGN